MGIQKAVKQILTEIGEDPAREGLEDTPLRIERMMKEITSGYGSDPMKIAREAVYEIDYDEMVIVKDTEFYSMCEHHMLPFFGKCHVAYIPNKKIIGLSKIPRIIEVFSRRLQVQERMTVQIANLLKEALSPKGVAGGGEGLPPLHGNARGGKIRSEHDNKFNERTVQER